MSVKGGRLFIEVLGNIQSKINSKTKLTVGFYSGSTEADGTPVATIAYKNEFGEGKIPARAFFRGMIAEKSGEWSEQLASVMRENELDVNGGLELMGEAIKDQLVQSIVDFKTPPNAPSTIARKGFDKPLIDTGTMSRSVGWELEK